MNKISIFHGSDKIIKTPQLSLGKKNNDYGQGFYCTEDMELAKEWAYKYGQDGFANKYELDISDLKIINLNEIESKTLSWITILLKNRTFDKSSKQNTVCEFLLKYYDVDLSNYDIVIGFRADDSYFSYAQKFIDNSLSFENLEKSLKLGMLGNQIALISEKAFSKIKFIEAIKADASIYFDKYISRDQKAREDYHIMTSSSGIDETYVMDIIRKMRKQK